MVYKDVFQQSLLTDTLYSGHLVKLDKLLRISIVCNTLQLSNMRTAPYSV